MDGQRVDGEGDAAGPPEQPAAPPVPGDLVDDAVVPSRSEVEARVGAEESPRVSETHARVHDGPGAIEPGAPSHPPRLRLRIPPVGPPRDLRRFLRRFAPAVVAIGIAVFASPLAERWPSKQSVEIELAAPERVTRVSLDVAERGEREPVYTATWTFDPGTAPQRIRAEWSTPDGPYDATIGVVRVGGAPTDETKRIDLDGNRVTLFPR